MSKTYRRHQWFVVFTFTDAQSAKELHREIHEKFRGSHIYRDDELIIGQRLFGRVAVDELKAIYGEAIEDVLRLANDETLSKEHLRDLLRIKGNSMLRFLRRWNNTYDEAESDWGYQ